MDVKTGATVTAPAETPQAAAKPAPKTQDISTNSEAAGSSTQASKPPEATKENLPVRVVSGVGHVVSWFMKHVIESGLPKDIVVTVGDFAVLMAAHPSAIQIEKVAEDVRQIVLDITGKGLITVRSNPATLVKSDAEGERLKLDVSHETTLTDEV